jgi:hypothetical protein
LQLYRKDLSGGPVVYASDASTFSWNGNMDVRASFALQMGTTTVIDSSRVVQNVTLGHSNTGARFEKDDWMYDTGGKARFYFENTGRTFFGSGGGYVFRDSSDVGRATISNNGGLNLLSGGDGQVSSTVALAVSGTTVIDSNRNIYTGNITAGNITAGNITPSGYISQGTGQSHYFRGGTDANWRIGSDITVDTGGLVNSAAIQMIVGGGSSPNYGFQIFGHTTPTVPVFEVLPQASAASSITNIRGKLYINNTEVIDNDKNLKNINTATLSSSTSMLLTLNPTANNYGGILFQYGGATKGSSIYNSGNLVYGGEAGVGVSLQAGGQYGLFIHPTTRNVGIGNGWTAPTYKLEVTGTLGVTGTTTLQACNPVTDNTYDLGTSVLRWRNVYTTDLHLSNEGKPEGNEVDGTTGNWTIQEGDENLYILNNKTGKKYKFALEEIT